MNEYPVAVVRSSEDEAFLADAPDVPYCSAHGATPEEALHEVRIAVEAWLEAARVGEDHPDPNTERPTAPPSFLTALLFVCSRNRSRSLTAERLFDGIPGDRVRSAGTAEGARIRVTAGHVGWADRIFAMEARHRSLLRDRFGQLLVEKPITVLEIPDDFAYMDDELVSSFGRIRACHERAGKLLPSDRVTMSAARKPGRRERAAIVCSL